MLLPWTTLSLFSLATTVPLVDDAVPVAAHEITFRASDGDPQILFVNRCTGGTTITRGSPDDSRSNRSVILPVRDFQFAPFPHGDATWDATLENVQDLLLPFNITVTDKDPGSSSHTEIIACANSFGPPQVLGLAPFSACNTIENAIGYVFASNLPNDPRRIAETIAHEAGHTWGLEHIFDCQDPMTYQLGCGNKYFSATPLLCGTATNDFFSDWESQPCECPSEERSTYNDLLASFGPSALAAPFGQFTSVAEGARVGPGAPVFVTIVSATRPSDASFYLDNTLLVDVPLPPWVSNLPAETPDGRHFVEIEIRDQYGRVGRNGINIEVDARCSCTRNEYCTDDFACEPKLPFGADCGQSATCETGLCASEQTGPAATGQCTWVCDPAAPEICPDGTECQTLDSQSVCWREPTSGGCCRASGTRPTPLWPVALFMLAFACRSRRSAPAPQRDRQGPTAS